jgi:simple sugar transport system permease protein
MTVLNIIVHQVINFFVPLLLVALGGMFAQRSGFQNVALEGMMTAGALAGMSFLVLTEKYLAAQLAFLIAIGLAGIAGIVIAGLYAAVSVKLKREQLLTGMSLNMIGAFFALYLIDILSKDASIDLINNFSIESIPYLSGLPVVGKLLFSDVYITTLIGVALLVLSAVVINNTRFGLRMTACGENAEAAASAGIRVATVRTLCLHISGFLAGMAGLVFVVTVSASFDGSVMGYGFLALAVLSLGRWKPMGVALSSLMLGLLCALPSINDQTPFFTGSSYLLKLIPYVAALLALAISSSGINAPKSLWKRHKSLK